MNILLCTHYFAPSIGGLEKVTAILAEQFSRLGAKVTVVAHTPGNARVSDSYEVVRRPSLARLCALARNSDVVLQCQISLRTILPVLLLGKPVIIAHHGVGTHSSGRWQDRLKRAVFPLCTNLAVSKAAAEAISVRALVVGNPFEADEFTVGEEIARDKDIVFLGRLIWGKGCDIALNAIRVLEDEGIHATLTVIGDGPEMPALRRLSVELGIADRVDFRGSMLEGRGMEVARHKIMAIPSRGAEGFGVVALEGLAAGCVLVASNAGGLPEAVGPCGLVFPNSEVKALAVALKRLLIDGDLRRNLLKNRKVHMERFQPESVARRYLEVFESVLKN